MPAGIKAITGPKGTISASPTANAKTSAKGICKIANPIKVKTATMSEAVT